MPGSRPCAPAVLLALLIYAYSHGAYSHGVRSSRLIERLCRRDAGYRFIVGEDVPDHTVIARFRRRHVERITWSGSRGADHVERMKSVFLHVLELCREAGLIRLGLVALDGRKIKANAALDANRTAGPSEEQIARMLKAAEATDVQEDRQFAAEVGGPAVPSTLARPADRLARLKAGQEKLEARAAAARQQEKLAARAAEEQATGMRKRGRKPKQPDPRVDPDTVANPTDPDSGIMKTRRGWIQGYTAQAVVTPAQIILAAEVTTEANDVHQLTGRLDQAQANAEFVLGAAAVLGAAVADAGSWSEANAASQTEECELFIAPQKDRKQRAALRDAPPPRGRRPKAMTARQRMERKLRTMRGRSLYRQPGAAVEPVFGQMQGPAGRRLKDRQGAGRFSFSMRGLERCRGEGPLDAAVHNLRKLHRGSIRLAENAGNSGSRGQKAA